MRNLLSEAVQLLTSAWVTGTLAPLEMCGAMALVELPPGVAGGAPKGDASSEDAKYVQVSMSEWCS